MRQSFWCFAVVSAMLTVSGSASAQVGELILQHGLVPSEGTSAIDEMVIEGGPGSAGSGFQIVINPNSTLSGNTAVLAAFERAARQWEQFISDPITVVINAGLQSLGSGILGSTFTPVVGAGMFDIVRDAMVLDAMDEGADDAIVASLPTASQFSFLTNGGTNPQVVNDIGMTRANAKALGFTLGAGADATINFSTNFAFDFDNSDGVGASLFDFESVAAHEIGHALGFVSVVDDIDRSFAQGNLSPVVAVRTLDMFRFLDDPAFDPSTAATFTTAPRVLGVGGSVIFDDLDNEYGMSTGAFFGDGRQASHWKDDDLTGTLIGTMDPTIGPGQVRAISYADLRSLDLIGYEIGVASAIPEPASMAMLGLGLVGVGAACYRRRGVRRRSA